jgi:hypothetical protein
VSHSFVNVVDVLFSIQVINSYHSGVVFDSQSLFGTSSHGLYIKSGELFSIGSPSSSVNKLGESVGLY